jgi:hypothetical protein
MDHFDGTWRAMLKTDGLQIFKQYEFEAMFNEQVENLKASGERARNGN